MAVLEEKQSRWNLVLNIETLRSKELGIDESSSAPLTQQDTSVTQHLLTQNESARKFEREVVACQAHSKRAHSSVVQNWTEYLHTQEPVLIVAIFCKIKFKKIGLIKFSLV